MTCERDTEQFALNFDGEHDDGVSRRHRVRSRTISIKRLSMRELERGRALYPDGETDARRPATRAECTQGENRERPCPFVSCKYHLYLDVSERTGAIKLNFPDLEVWEMTESCALDIAARDGVVLEEVGVIMNLTRERVRQIETKGLAKLAALAALAKAQDPDDLDESGRAALGFAQALDHCALDVRGERPAVVERDDESEDEQPQREPMRGGLRPEWARGGVGFLFPRGLRSQPGLKFTPVAPLVTGESLDSATDDVSFSVQTKDEVSK